MCGIVGYIGPRKAVSVLMQGLKQLEYRGYDSSGISVLNTGNIKTFKSIGKLVNLESIVPEKSRAKSGIGHTRWATHGKVTDKNAHPHISNCGKISVVHNGIIDNYITLKKELIDLGYTFNSETDSEVLVHLIHSYIEKGNEPVASVQKALERLDGTYGVVVLFAEHPDMIIGARNGSPLIVGVGDGEMFLGSDATAFIGLSKQAIYLDDGELVVLTAKSYQTINRNNKVVEKELEAIALETTKTLKGDYPHFFLKEIHEQPESIRRAIGDGGRLLPEFGTAKLGGLNLDKRDFFDIKRIHIIAMGSALYSGMVGASVIENLARIPTQVFDASELRYSNPIVDKETLFIAVSQSGETADTILAVKEILNKGGRVLGVINSVGSTLARLTHGGMYIHAGQEVSVAATKSFSNQITVLNLFALVLGRMRDVPLSRGKELVQQLLSLPDKVEEALKCKEIVKKIAYKYKDSSSILFLARGTNYPIALEGALKVKEVSYLHAEGFSAGGLKHGPLALVCPETPSVFIVTEGEYFEKMIGNIQEVIARDGKAIIITTSKDKRLEELADDYIQVPEIDELLSPLLTIIPMQLFSYYISLALGRDIDQPRNLAKSVTTE
ncbi:MAG: glutamine--fructose-6-phosphate transaminase (isomerizing) [Spirochaetaceae bacterium]